jgi:TRAP-type C4-dicarboxylate transport system substrate-binding protein
MHRRILLLLGACLALNASAQDVQERILKFGHLNNTDHPTSTGVKKFAEIVAARSGGKIKVQEFASSQLGNELQQQSAMQGGVQEMFVASTTSLAGVVKEFGVFDFPFLFSNSNQADAMVDGPLGKLLGGGWPTRASCRWPSSTWRFRNVTNSKRPITRAEDLDGLKLRVIPNPVFMETFKTFKANPVPMPLPSSTVHWKARPSTARRTRTAVILSNKFYEVNKYVSATNHVIRDANPCRSASASGTSCRPPSSAAQRAVAGLQARGMQFNELSAAEQQRMGQVAKPVTDRLAASYDPALVKLYNDELARVRK